ncbi:MAG: oligosaccharide flippase family protein [Acidobacteriota bacterium]|nr:oligosaccharide flippase family protein [Acidobacteriota bacterium]
MNDAALEELEPILEHQPLPADVIKNVVSGTSALGIGVVLERAFGFLSNILAARLGGASTFGAYSLAISTANNISTYAAGGIGSTAIRFSGEYSRGTRYYTTLAKVLALIAFLSAFLAATVLWLGASPLARLVQKPDIVPVLRWAAFSAAGIIFLECARGFFVGQRRLKAVVLLSGFVGIGMISVLPIASHFGPVAMICGQSFVILGAVLVCIALYKPLELSSPVSIETPAPFVPMLKRVWSYGLMQLSGLVGLNAAGWWLTSLVAKGDPTMVQMSYFAVAHQFRNVVALVPSLLTEGSFSEMANANAADAKTPDNVMAMCTYVTTLICLMAAGAAIIVAPWMLLLIYGKAYTAAATTTALALATALVHMGSWAAAQRLSVLSIRLSGIINAIWAVFVGVTATVFLLRSSDAAKGAAVYLAAHLLSAVLLLVALKSKGNLPTGMTTVFSWGTFSVLGLALLSIGRHHFASAQLPLTAGSVVWWIVAVVTMIQMGKRRNWLPSRALFERFLNKLPLIAKLLPAARI